MNSFVAKLSGIVTVSGCPLTKTDGVCIRLHGPTTLQSINNRLTSYGHVAQQLHNHS